MRNIFETVVSVESPRKSITIKEDKDNIDGLNFLAGKEMDFVNKKAMEGTMLAYAVYFFEKACGISGYLLAVNPFDQPGVEAYKKYYKGKTIITISIKK